MARALALKGGASPDERENVKWQTLQVSSMSIASCIGRILIGIFLLGVQFYFHKVQLVLNRRHGGLGKTQGDEADPMPLFGGRVFPRFSAGWPPCSGN